MLSACRPLRQHEVADLRGRIPDADLYVLTDFQPELAQYTARIDHGARPVGGGFVPDRREAEDRPGITGAQRAHHEVMALRGVLDDNHVVARTPAIAELGDVRRCIARKPFFFAGAVPVA